MECHVRVNDKVLIFKAKELNVDEFVAAAKLAGAVHCSNPCEQRMVDLSQSQEDINRRIEVFCKENGLRVGYVDLEER